MFTLAMIGFAKYLPSGRDGAEESVMRSTGKSRSRDALAFPTISGAGYLARKFARAAQHWLNAGLLAKGLLSLCMRCSCAQARETGSEVSCYLASL